MAPVSPGREGQVSKALAAMPTGAASPLGRVVGTHFARLVFVPYLESRRRRPRRGAGAFLLYAAEFDGEPDAYVEGLRDGCGAELDPVFAGCDRYPGAGDDSFGDWLRAHVVRSQYSVRAYPDVTVDEIRESIELRDRLSRFVLRTKGLAPAELQRAWREEFGGPGR
jgi:hypothetical protein